ncbi:MAG: hypothetical protein JNK05_11880 [Myxococcales bacterium]|nr:hypothetical protein [Myxococcales bacterium]
MNERLTVHRSNSSLTGVLRSIALLAPMVAIEACDRTSSASRNTEPAQSNAGSSSEPSNTASAADAAATLASDDNDSGTQEGASTNADPQQAANGERCSTPGERRRAVVPEGAMPCTCAGDAGAARWVCDPGAMRVMGPLPPPELAA